jgi:hypothetical protein
MGMCKKQFDAVLKSGICIITVSGGEFQIKKMISASSD